MTRIFVYEHITAHGIGRDPASPEHSLHVEGRAMFDAIRADFAAIAGVEVLTGGPEDFAELAARGDWSFVIAPETDGRHPQRSR
jgi:predicted ATP-grasp superfamily ATP-dependent carboligase